ncbi:MerR family transcriptional regulator [Streptomyces sp. NBC_01089]|uniref:MerR family transcriptional regulator n=1 Tax=Streptomyces sp. NBC_01089 TaxID=2903747 RepID=UPI00386C838E|nr:MerR family transcriptional regulator [Streptomyces sp. NBC_01089]
MTVTESPPVNTPPVPAQPLPGRQDRYTISQVAAFTGLSAHTLRWYEQIGLMPEVERSHSGQRVFSGADLEWLSCVARLRLTGMPVAVMVRYAELVRRGATADGERREILEQTRHDVVARIAELQDTLIEIDSKIDCCQGARRTPERA